MYILSILEGPFMTKQTGLTLMELMIIIAIIGILSAIAVPNMISWRSNAQFSSAVRMVKIAIEDTRMTAIKTNMNAKMEFTDGSDSFDTARWDFSSNAYAAPVTIKLPPGTIIADLQFSSGDRLEFNGRGLTTSFGNLHIENTSGSLCRKIVVSKLGSSRIESCP
jgi:prepilin-type N-terminal cleavage/methylation domain-containing protein